MKVAVEILSGPAIADGPEPVPTCAIIECDQRRDNSLLRLSLLLLGKCLKVHAASLGAPLTRHEANDLLRGVVALGAKP